MRTPTSTTIRRTTAAMALAGLGALTLGVAAPAAAESTETQTVAVDLGDLDNSGSGVFDQFDPALGTLTAVTIEADVSMSFDVCTTNRSEVATTVPAGSASGEAVLTFAGGVVATASDTMSVNEDPLTGFDGTDDCAAFADGGPAPTGGDSSITSQAGVVETFSETITAAEQLAPYIGTGTVGFDWAPTSTSNVGQPSGWTIVFLASGDGEARITYEYTPGENPPEPPPVNPPEPPPVNPPEPPDTLPNTGGPNEALVALAGLLLMIGGGLIALRRAGSTG